MPLTTRKRASKSVGKVSDSSAKLKKTSTRNATNECLIGFPEEKISGSKLPTLRQVMKVVLHQKSTFPRKTNRDHFASVIEQVSKFWRKAGIETIQKWNLILRLEKVHKEWKTLKKYKNPEKEKCFTEILNKLWDIGSPKAIEIINNNRLLSSEDKERDIAFYMDQRNEREATMSGKDKNFQKRLLRKLERPQRKTSRTDQHEIDTGDILYATNSTLDK